MNASPEPAPGPSAAALDREVEIPVGPVSLPGRLTLPAGARGVVVFAHGSGSSRLSRRNQFVAEVLQRHGVGTLLLDLLTEPEAGSRANVFDIPLLAGRVAGAVAWLGEAAGTRGLGLGLFGASTGAAAALVAAARAPERIQACVSRGGRPDLAGDSLPEVRAPTLLIVGGHDEAVIELNREAIRQLTCPCELVIVPGATHLFEEAGTLEEVARLAADWFARHLAPRAPAR